jgi:hypothetical protein
MPEIQRYQQQQTDAAEQDQATQPLAMPDAQHEMTQTGMTWVLTALSGYIV